MEPRKRRKSPRALRFADLKVGDQLLKVYSDPIDTEQKRTWYYLVTDLWFDPVAGQEDETAGRMVGIAHIDPRTGEPRSRKEATTLRGLASQGYRYSDLDFMTLRKTTIAAAIEGKVVGIGRGHVIRRRPKIAAPQF